MNRFITFSAIILFSHSAYCQHYFEFGMFGGACNYQGDLAPIAFVPSETHLAYGGFAKINFNKYFSAKVSLYTGTISGSDQNSSKHFNQNRNLSFRSDIEEASVFGEMNLFGYDPHIHRHVVTPYAFAGIGVFHFNPQAYYMGEWYDLQPLGTEGQGTKEYPFRKPYKLTQMSFPIGGGFKIAASHRINIGIEMGWRKTLTDYLDDVSTTYVSKDILVAENGQLSWELSNRTDEVNGGVEVLKDDTHQRGDSTNDDWYIFSGVMVSYNLGLIGWDSRKFKYKGPGASAALKRSRKKMKCPNMDKIPKVAR